MKFIKAITLTLIGFSSQVLSTTASAPIDQFDEEQSRGNFQTKAEKEPMLFRAGADAKADKIPTPTTNYYYYMETQGGQPMAKTSKQLPTTNYYMETQGGKPIAKTSKQLPITNYYMDHGMTKTSKELPTTNYYQQETQGGQPMANPDNCPAPSRRQVIGNKCLGPNQVPTVCCGRNKRRSYVACMPVDLQTCFTGGRGNSGHGADIEFHSDSDSATLSLSAVSEQPKPNASSFPCHNVAGRCFS
jgi:hypothetical protein